MKTLSLRNLSWFTEVGPLSTSIRFLWMNNYPLTTELANLKSIALTKLIESLASTNYTRKENFKSFSMIIIIGPILVLTEIVIVFCSILLARRTLMLFLSYIRTHKNAFNSMLWSRCCSSEGFAWWASISKKSIVRTSTLVRMAKGFPISLTSHWIQIISTSKFWEKRKTIFRIKLMTKS